MNFAASLLVVMTLLAIPSGAQSLPTISGTAMDQAPSSWTKIGPAWGPASAWQFGFDSSATASVCAFDGVAKGQKPKYIVGPCRDFFLLAKNGKSVYHVGMEFLGYDVRDVARSHPYYLGRIGIAVGPFIHSGLAWASDRLPYIEQIASWDAPKAFQYLGNITTIDAGGGPGVGVKPVYGGAVKLNLPLADVSRLFKSASGS